jgi:COP9 signalosome complex subunit 4
MENLTRKIQSAVQTNDFATIASVFTGFGPDSWQNVGQGEQRSLASDFICQAVANLYFLEQAVKNPEMEQTFLQALGHLPATVPNAADNVLRQALFDAKVNADDADYAGAARILGGMRMEDDTTSVYYTSKVAKAEIYVKIAECFLAEDEIAESDSAVNKAGSAVESLSIEEKEGQSALLLRYKSTTARVLDANRKFLQAASRYHELSQSSSDLLDAEELLHFLGRATTCAILAPSGGQRQRILGHLYRDERLSELDRLSEFCTHAKIVRKMYRHQILQESELKQLEESLDPHQKAIMGDGLSILERGVVEHNMVAVSKTYRSIYITTLTKILNVDERRAEKLAASMIREGFLHGSMDQVNGLLEFDAEELPEVTWDRSLMNFCSELNRVADAIKVRAST